jgi:uridine phosphorylase
MCYLITSQQTLSAARRAEPDPGELERSSVAVVTYSRGVLERLDDLCGLEDVAWISPRHHPYAAVRVIRQGAFGGTGVTAVVPPMGASPLACILEDLVACGVRAIFLVCAAWSLGPPVRFGDLIVPSFSLGFDGTSIHYGNTRGEIHTPPSVVEALVEACHARGVRTHVGGNATCEALYRITPEKAEAYRGRRCLCMENGEASTLLAVTRTLGVLGGVLFQPYIDLTRGWDPARLDRGVYPDTCRLQAEVALRASVLLGRRQLL